MENGIQKVREGPAGPCCVHSPWLTFVFDFFAALQAIAGFAVTVRAWQDGKTGLRHLQV
jgi:hypothetical protein